MGLAWSFLSESYFLGSPEWTADKVPDLTGKITIVTGANTGIGKETAKVLLQHNATVYIAARNKEKVQQAIEDLKAQTGREAHFLLLDLSSLKSVKAAADDFTRRETQLHILFNNAGVMYPPISLITADGFDLQFGTNTLGHFYFTKLLLPTLLATAQTTPDKKVRVVNVSSWGHRLAHLDFNTFKDGPARRRQSTGFLYGQSKYGNIVFANELARKYGEQGICSTSLHPGAIDSELTRHMHIPSPISSLLQPLLAHPVSYGALTQLRAGTAPEAAEWNGEYLTPWAKIGTPESGTKDETLGKQLWEYMEEQVKDI